MLRTLSTLVAIAAAAAVGGCSSASSSTVTGAAPVVSGSSAPTASASPAPTATATATAGASPTTTATAAATATLAGCPASRRISALPVLARPSISPDDLLAMADGSLWISDPVSGGIVHVDSGGRQLQRIDPGQAPEGMVALGDGRIVLAEQTPNRLVTFTPPATATTTLLTLPARGASDGVDGIGLDAAGGRILVPDSPHGTLLALPVAGGSAQRLATGLGRDVGAAIGPDGAVWVVVEGNRGLWRRDGMQIRSGVWQGAQFGAGRGDAARRRQGGGLREAA